MGTGRPQDIQHIHRMHRYKSHTEPFAVALGTEMVDFFKQSVAKRQTKLEKIAELWSALVPELQNEHCSLESFSRGTLTVMVDSASHLFELKQLLVAGLEAQLRLACKSAGLRKITLRPGRWYVGDSAADRQMRFGR